MNITTCTRCGNAYEESSQERANESDRLCGGCFEARCLNRFWNGTATDFEARVAFRNFPLAEIAKIEAPAKLES